ncbi:TetR/AcrR family transcriptional regulator [Mangrovimicrobium sediminis]|uniref:TetR/AcrR family transcriptional regulator n=1 Tax=Mangrovimicrobium sediminis TaxID=2562682 RepID=A0A4Z0M1Q8_9GAMM|nr:TetR/AcrR family transcriptional regulator [Haliea sp. SAOS-164]TGD73420.1 TetR/AcrR family transcriptional regulator [Haliea sp. SAOS-164]
MQPEELESRRQGVARVAAELIAREGLEAATVRRIAAELGCSTTMITHYFNDKEEVLLLAYQHIAQQGADRVQDALRRHPDDLAEVMVSMAAVGAEALSRWRVYLAFRERASYDTVFAAEQRRWVEHTLDTVTELVRGRCREEDSARETAQLLIALVHGIALQTLFDPDLWPEAAIRAALHSQVRHLLSD